MSTPHESINIKAQAVVVEWKDENDQVRCLSDPDPVKDDLELDLQFDGQASAVSLKFRIPVRVKGITAKTHILCILSSAEHVASLEYDLFPTPPEEVKRKLNCSIARLHIKLNQPLTLIVPSEATEPLAPRKLASKSVFDAARSLAETHNLTFYLPDKALPQKTHFTAIQRLISDDQLQSLDRPDDLATLYGGKGGKLFEPSAHPSDAVECDEDGECPPSYDTIDSPPPMAPLTDTKSNKRRRLDSSVESVPYDAIYAHVTKMQADFEQRLSRQYGQKFKDLQEEVKKMKKKVESLEEEVATLKTNAESDTEQTQLVQVNMLQLETDVAEDLRKMRSELDDVNDKLQEMDENGIDSEVKERIVEESAEKVVERINERSYRATVQLTAHLPL